MTQPLDYASRAQGVSGRLSPWGKGFLAVAGTLFLAGFGHLLAGRPRRAAGWFAGTVLSAAAAVAAMLMPALLPALFVLVPLCLLLSLACIVDAFICGRRSTGAMLYTPALRYVTGLALIAVGAFLQPMGRLARRGITPFVEGYVMPTKGMSPTFEPGDRLLALKTHLTIRRWDLVVFHPPIAADADDTWVMRVVGLPGEKIEIINGVVNVNGHPTSPPEPIGPNVLPGLFPSSNGPEGHPISLRDGEYFVLGDNSPISNDSRMWHEGTPGHQPGALPADHIIGRATAIYWPLNRCRRFP